MSALSLWMAVEAWRLDISSEAAYRLFVGAGAAYVAARQFTKRQAFTIALAYITTYLTALLVYEWAFPDPGAAESAVIFLIPLVTIAVTATAAMWAFRFEQDSNGKGGG